ncbi:hypothetical protein K3M67_06195 [Sphingobium sp. V4]|uniref:hypothetical protein n=1 Tax=Sphingobium sp. V4 TaxID=3038927 RepID=UPI002557E10E|nr:hypothetical protein [Sphingobium sp. V4]WIW89548.1 hypothetical protein K3M67_06195 [Sphingobium sp. V4]
MRAPLIFLLGIPGIVIGGMTAEMATAQPISQDAARRAAIHPVADPSTMQAWLSRVPLTRDFPPDFGATLKGDAPAFVVEMTTAPGCAPCADLWTKLQTLRRQYDVNVDVLSREEAMVRSGRLGLPWVGHPVAWARATNDPNRVIPIAIGTDHSVNLARNIYLAFKMMTGVRPDVGVRAMAKFTGIVGVAASPPLHSKRN